MNIAPVSMSNYFGKVSFEGGKPPQAITEPASKQTKKSISNLASKFSSKMSKCWNTIKNFAKEHVGAIFVGTEIVVTGVLLACAGHSGIKKSEQKEEAQDYIEQTDLDRYMEMCIMEARGIRVDWIKTANILKASVEKENHRQEDSLRIYRKGFQDGLKQARQETLNANENK